MSEFSHAVSLGGDTGAESGPRAGDLAGAKAAVRATVLARRRRYPPGRAADQAILAALVPLVPAGARVAGYSPLPGEPGGADLLTELARAAGSGTVLLPVLRPDNDLDWAGWTGVLRPGPKGLSQPDGPPLGVAAISSVGLVVVPAVAVGRDGVRLGRGGGSYDRALARVPAGVPVLALLYDGELLDAVPAQPHDRRVGAVITPAGGLVRLPVPPV